MLATTNPFTMTDKPHVLFADAPVVLNPDAPGGAVPLAPQPAPFYPPQNLHPPNPNAFSGNLFPQNTFMPNPLAPNPMAHLNAPMMPNMGPPQMVLDFKCNFIFLDEFNASYTSKYAK